MARGDFRYTPHYQFWTTTILSALIGVGLAWLFSTDGIGATLSRFAVTVPIYILVFWFLWRSGSFQTPVYVEPYEHPILGFYAGVAAALTLLLLDESVLRALLVGLVLGGVVAVGAITSRRWRTRDDSPDRHRPISTLTGWR